MGSALSLAVADAFAPAERRLLLLTVGGTIVLLIGLWFGASVVIAALHVTGWPWLNVTIDVLGSVATLFLAWLVFPSMAILMLGFFLDRVIAEVESRHYPELPAPRVIGIGASLAGALRLALLALLLNVLALPLYIFFPVINVVLFLGINGYLVGREYFEAVASRRLEYPLVKAMWRHYRARLVIAGAIIAFMLSVPVLNLAAPLIGVAFMLHFFEHLRRIGSSAFVQ
ncbi:MAG TPA: EI24 domain-containing protein [Stellaceae bacterium]|nr:EI24 domain-containing protein [Stellaceae bacterium]